MQIIKEHCPSVGKCVVRTNCYGHTLQFLHDLFTEAQKDFPQLQADKVDVVHYAGRRYSRTYGLEFDAKGDVPDSYSEIAKLEFKH